MDRFECALVFCIINGCLGGTRGRSGLAPISSSKKGTMKGSDGVAAIRGFSVVMNPCAIAMSTYQFQKNTIECNMKQAVDAKAAPCRRIRRDKKRSKRGIT
jgi:hypothetical protein